MAEQKLHYNAAGTHVHVAHSETGGRWECPVDYLPTARLRSWEPVEPEDDALDGLFDDSTAEGEEQTGFDPAEHDVDGVSAHLAEHAESSPGEVVRVLELERAGKNRKTVVVPDGFEPITGD
ncbi:MAG: hypothetical protein ABIR39_19790 [Nocardioides sp.]|uniref:hypothetical protein n=1 Tax=Nocardioides sp. TaxID=35761 RepID=UPI0032663DBC